jgi:hypothetical protein
MIHISIQHKQYRNYTQTDDCIITGEAFNGFYALIKHTDGKSTLFRTVC